jgi:uncharacterized membrane protein YedE/YeeE
MEDSQVIMPLFGGILIGLASSIMLLFNGKIMGVSGILGGMIKPKRGDYHWRLGFLLGLVLSGVGFMLMQQPVFAFDVQRSIPVIALAGLLVGFGTRLGNGCTSGHGICGISRFSPRSILATITFMIAGIAVVYVVNHMLGGVL